jgi:hypothetical protein
MRVKTVHAVMALSLVVGLVLLRNSISASSLGSDFEIVFKYGVKGPYPEPRNVLNTLRDTFTRDMVVDPPVTIRLLLTQGDLEAIRGKMDEIGFYVYPRGFRVNVSPGEAVGEVTPFSSYHVKVYSRGVLVKELYWDDNIFNKDESAEALREFFSLIIELIESKPEVKRMPQPRAGYC